MKRAYTYLAIALLAVIGAACTKSPAIEDASEGYKIVFGTPGVKSEGLTPDTANPLQMQVFDYFTAEGETEIQYINDIIQKSEEGPWSFVAAGQPNDYYWKAGTHQFFGWVIKDEAGATLPNISGSGKVLTLAETEFNGSSSFDYRYSEITTIPWTKAVGGAPVELTVKHLASGLTYSITNESDDQSYEVTGVKVENVATKASATVTYSGAAAVPAIVLNTTKGDIELASGVQSSAWPQTLSGAKLTVDYTYETTTVDEESGESTTTTVEKTESIDLPAITWEPGKCYNYDIQVIDKSIKLTLKVIDWGDKSGTIAYGSGSIITAMALEYSSGAAVTTGSGRRQNNYFANATDPIKAYFSVYAPVGKTWKIKISGDTGLFTVTSEQATSSSATELSGPIGGADGNTGRVEFTIAKNASATASNSIKLDFVVVDGDREMSINSEVTRKNALTITGQVKE